MPTHEEELTPELAPRLVSVRGAAVALGVDPSTVYRMLGTGDLWEDLTS